MNDFLNQKFFKSAGSKEFHARYTLIIDIIACHQFTDSTSHGLFGAVLTQPSTPDESSDSDRLFTYESSIFIGSRENYKDLGPRFLFFSLSLQPITEIADSLFILLKSRVGKVLWLYGLWSSS